MENTTLIEEPILEKDAPWKRRFRTPRIMIQVADRNPDRSLVISNESGMYELYAFDLPSNTLKQRTHRPSGTIYGSISPDGQHIYYMNDREGNETGHIVRIPFEGTDEAQDLTPSLPDYALAEPSIDDTSSRFGITIPSEEGFDSYVVDISGGVIGKPRLINRSKKLASGPIFSHDGKVSIVVSAERFGGLDFTLTSFDTQSGERLTELADESSRIEPSDFSPIGGDQRILAASNRSGVMRPLIWDAAKGTRSDLNIADLEGEVEGMAWSPDAKSVLLCQINKASTRLWLYDIDSQVLRRVVHSDGTIAGAWFRTRETLLLAWQDSTNPTQLIEVDLHRSTVSPRKYLVPRDVPESRAWQSASFQSSDGQEIQCWFATPDGLGPFPTILETHGGPSAAQFNVFSPRSQIWIDHGFAYATINYRGSTTFGKEFEKKINGDLGHWEVEDMVAARLWLIKSRIARPDEIFVTGWSYGGYLTLQSMSLYPDLWAGGMGGVVVADWVTEFDDEPPAMKGYDVALLEGTPTEKPEAYSKASPINYLERLSAPLLIIQAKNDVRDPPRQVELYEAKAKALGKDVKVVWFETGHAGSGIDVVLSISHYEIMLRWLYDVLRRRTLGLSSS